MIVVDTNILAYRWLPQSVASPIDELLRIDSEWAAPLLWRSELRNVLAGFLRRRRLHLAEAQQIMHHASNSLSGGEHFVSDDLVLNLVSQSGCSAYDCEFVALAHSLRVLLVTEDQAILAAFPENCRSLKEAIRTGLNR